MIVSCPQCSSRYRINDDKIQGAGARIKCPSCQHRFVVYRESEKHVVGGSSPKPKGVPVTFARKGQLQRAEVPEDVDEEADAPTTLMPHGSSMADDFRKALQAERQRMLHEESKPAPQAPRAVPPRAAPPQVPVSAPPKPPAAEQEPVSKAPDLRAHAKASKAANKDDGGVAKLAAGMVLVVVLLAGGMYAAGLFG